MQISLPQRALDLIALHPEAESFYLYDSQRLAAQLQSLSGLPPRVKVYYAMKANPNRDLLKYLASQQRIAGFEIASIGEAEKAAKALGGSLARAIFTGPGKGLNEIKYCIDNGLKTFNVESLTEAHRINRAVPDGIKQPILLRVSTNQEIHGAEVQMSRVEAPVPFGVGEDEILDVIRSVQELPNLSLEGLHFYSATGVMSAKLLLDTVEYALKFTTQIERELVCRFRTVDLGGGFGIDYAGSDVFDINGYCSGLQTLIDKYGFGDRELILELGRYIAADMGYFATTISDIKSSHGKTVIITRAGINAHRRPYALKTEYPISIFRKGKPSEYPNAKRAWNETVTIHGPLCTPVDRLSTGIKLDDAKIGDLIVMHKAGAYGLSMSSVDFLSHPKIPEFFH